jgi:hypothetical protein
MFVCGFALSDIANHLNKVLNSIDLRLTQLQQEIKDESAQAREDRQIRRNQPSTRKDAVVSAKRKMRLSLATLKADLVTARDRGDLDHILTVEDCPTCAAGSHDPRDQDCKRDILYYNIDVRLIEALMEFRAQYFQNDSFLPEPYHRHRLDIFARQMGGDAEGAPVAS